MESIIDRIKRVYCSINTAEEKDLKKLKADIIQTDKYVGFHQDFRGGLTDPELSNQIHTIISNIANLADHLRQWARKNDKNPKQVDEAFKNCAALQILQDLNNNDKHGYPPRNNGYSGKAPKLININRIMRLQTQVKNGSGVTMTFGSGGVPEISGDGTEKAIVTGEIVDNNDTRIGDFLEIASKATKTWEQLLIDWRLLKSSC